MQSGRKEKSPDLMLSITVGGRVGRDAGWLVTEKFTKENFPPAGMTVVVPRHNLGRAVIQTVAIENWQRQWRLLFLTECLTP